MSIFLAALGCYMAVVGAALCFKPPLGKRLADLWLKDKVHRGWALVTLGIGALLIWAAPVSRAVLFIQVLGWLTVLKGIYLLIAPRGQLVGVVKWWNRLSEGRYRLWGLVTLTLGAAILITL